MPHQKLRQQNAGCTDNNSIRTNGRLCLLPTFVIGKTSFNLNAVYQWFKIKSPSSAAVIKLSIRPPTIEQNDQPLKMTDEFFDRTSPTPLSCFVRHLCLSSPARRPLSSYSSQSTRSTSARAHVSTLRKEVDEALNIIRSVPEAISQSLAVKNELSGAPEKKKLIVSLGENWLLRSITKQAAAIWSASAENLSLGVPFEFYCYLFWLLTYRLYDEERVICI